MDCPGEGELRAWLDRETDLNLEGHLVQCPHCTERLERLKSNYGLARTALAPLTPLATELPDVADSLRQFRRRGQVEPVAARKGWISMVDRGFGPWGRLAAVAAVVVALGLLMALTPAGPAMGAWLSVFRAEQFAPVTLDPQATARSLDALELSDFGEIRIVQEPDSELIASVAEAKVDFKVRLPAYLPASLQGTHELMYTSAASFEFKFDRARAQAASKAAGLPVNLPQSVHGAVARGQLPASVQAFYLGDEDDEAALLLYQGGMPSVELPGFLEDPATREMLYEMLGVPLELANQLEAVVVKGNTMPVPVLKGDQSRQVEIDGGASGVLVSHRDRLAGEPEGTYLVWQKGGVIYALGGTVSEAELIKVANSLR